MTHTCLRHFITWITISLLATLSATSTLADDTLQFSGYLRSGSNWLASGGTLNGGSCYALEHPSNDGFYYRLGNECRDYAEFQFAKLLKNNDVNFKVVWMMDIAGDSRSSTAVEPWSRRSRQLYVETDNLLENGTLWVGRRYYRGIVMGDIHIIDMFHVQSSGNGAGVSNLRLTDHTKAHFAVISYGSDGDDDGESFNYNNLMLDARSDTYLGDLGNIKLALQHVEPHAADDSNDYESGTTLTIQWEKKLGNVDQKTVFQYGTGSMAENPGCAGTDGGCMNPTTDGGNGFRLFNNGHISFSDRFKMNYLILFEDSEDLRQLMSLGVRPHLQLSKHWSFVSEIATIQLDKEDDPSTQKLNKVTLALQATTDAFNFWDRPALRFYLSNFMWNDQAAATSGLNVPGEEDEDNALLLGMQAEVWF